MPEEKKYVQPPQSRKIKSSNKTIGSNVLSLWGKIKGVYDNLAPNYWKQKLPHLLIVIPVVFFIYMGLIIWFLFSKDLLSNAFLAILLGYILVPVLTLVSAFFYPYSLFWYKNSFLGQILNNMYYFGGFFSIFLKIIATVIGGVIIAGFFSPIAGVLTWRKLKKENKYISGE